MRPAVGRLSTWGRRRPETPELDDGIPMSQEVIALDADGVLVDYSTAYAKAWEKAFLTRPTERDPEAYWPIDRWGVERLSGEPLERFRRCFDEAFWSGIPAVNGALQACRDLTALRILPDLRLGDPACVQEGAIAQPSRLRLSD